MTRAGCRACFIGAAAFVIFSVRSGATCQTACEPTQKAGWEVGDTYSVSISSTLPSASQSAILNALDYWNSWFTANGMPARFTYISVGPGQINISVDPSLQNSGKGAVYDHPPTNGNGSITLNPDYINDTALLMTIM